MTDRRIMYASSVGEKEGVGVELWNADRSVILEVFRNDITGDISFTATGPCVLPLDEVLAFLDKATADIEAWPSGD